MSKRADSIKSYLLIFISKYLTVYNNKDKIDMVGKNIFK